jgi:hypothetical protein
MAAVVLFRPNATAQPPTTVRTIAASPQGEWVAIQEGYFSGSSGDAGNSSPNNVLIGLDPTYARVWTWGNFRYFVLYHTGTGKSRIVAWRDQNGIQNFMTFDTP